LRWSPRQLAPRPNLALASRSDTKQRTEQPNNCYFHLVCHTVTFNTLNPQILESLSDEVLEQLPAIINGDSQGPGVDKAVANLWFSMVASGASLESLAARLNQGLHDTYLQHRVAWRRHEAQLRQPDSQYFTAQSDLQPADFGDMRT
jgi:hypothetical protein